MREIYLDNAATTVVIPEALAAARELAGAVIALAEGFEKGMKIV